MPFDMLHGMATRHLAPDSSARRIWVDAAPIRRKKRFRWLRRIAWGVVILALILIAAWIYALQVYAPGLRHEASNVPTKVRSQLAEHRAPYVSLTAISPYLREAIVAVEDRRFYSHPGVDPLGMVRAFWVNLTAQHVDQGGSTLEEQLVKRVIVQDDRSIRAKLRTIGLAWAIDQEFSKSKILELYLNDAYYGQGAYGAASAARVFFGTDAAHLSLGQAAFLAALPQAPSIYGANPMSASIQHRWRTVLSDMASQGDITNAQADAAANMPLHFAFPTP
jgi:membrane peptidoglycan carboxypeptidase